MEQNLLIHDVSGLLWDGTGWYLVVLAQYGAVLVGTGSVWSGTG